MLPIPERRERCRENNPPTLLILSGISECRNEILRDAKWWLTSVQPPVNIVITMYLDLRPRTIAIEVWKLLTSREDHSCSRDCNRLCSKIALKVILTPVDDTNNYRASRDLTLSFRDIVLRKPPVGEEEIVFSKQDLEDWTKSIFERIDRSA
ncbi:uncharacterized protein KD926_004885 [Aspergillus affinis]|uniref:uncharacterized protein n=1 Tax=Aspergillus affinis TaxID=1070780 RepID=UPI0022FF39F8|nr:uncharacterized protein KD926_004885 [Aspergillus affinis]KAI9042820.1 hypothetical protein KD926_004885 [Aspergillus affinis]